MKQKRLGNILYVFDVMPYEITQDTDATTIKVQEESYKGFVEMNQDLAEKIVRYNYHTMIVRVPEWAPYADAEDPQGSLTFGIYGAAAADAINQIQVQNADNVILQSWVAGVDLEFPFQTDVEEGQHCVIECKEGIYDLFNQFDVTGAEYLPVHWIDQETRHYWYATQPISESISIGINAVEPSAPHTVEITSDIAMAEIMEQTPDHQTIVNTYTSPSSPFTMTVNDGNIVTVEFDNGEPSNIYDIDPNGFFAGQWQNPDTGKYISWSEPISDDVNVTIATPQPSVENITYQHWGDSSLQDYDRFIGGIGETPIVNTDANYYNNFTLTVGSTDYTFDPSNEDQDGYIWDDTTDKNVAIKNNAEAKWPDVYVPVAIAGTDPDWISITAVYTAQ